MSSCRSIYVVSDLIYLCDLVFILIFICIMINPLSGSVALI